MSESRGNMFQIMHLSSETPTTPTPDKHGAYVGIRGDWTFLGAPWGGGLGQFRQLSSRCQILKGVWD